MNRLLYKMQFLPQISVVWKSFFDQRPEPRRMIELNEVAELVDDYIIPKMLRQKEEPIIEGNGSPSRAAPPAGFLIPDAHFLPGNLIDVLKESEALKNKFLGLRQKRSIFCESPFRFRKKAGFSFGKSRLLLLYPGRLAL